MAEPYLTVANGSAIPQLAFGLYMVPADDEGVKIILEAIKVCTSKSDEKISLIS